MPNIGFLVVFLSYSNTSNHIFNKLGSKCKPCKQNLHLLAIEFPQGQPLFIVRICFRMEHWIVVVDNSGNTIVYYRILLDCRELVHFTNL